nr:DUF58 domain-containing protein [bacterium]
MRTRRILFFLMMVVWLIAGMYTGNTIYYWMLCLQCVMVLVAFASLAWMLIRFSYNQTLTPETGIKGQSIELKMGIHNDTFMPFPYVEITYATVDTAIDGKLRSARMGLPPRQSRTITAVMPCNYRGVYTVGLQSVRVYDMFGLFSSRIKLERLYYHKNFTLSIYPEIYPLPRIAMPAADLESVAEEHRLQTDDVAMPTDIRGYRYGDPLRHVHWKLSMRKGDLIIKLFEQYTRPDVLVFLDATNHGHSGIEATQLEDCMASTAISLAAAAMDRGLPVRLIGYGMERTEIICRIRSDLSSMMEYLCRLAFDGPFRVDEILKSETMALPNGTALFFVTSHITIKLLQVLNNLQKSGIEIRVLLVELPQDQAHDRQLLLEQLRKNGTCIAQITVGDSLEEGVKAL